MGVFVITLTLHVSLILSALLSHSFTSHLLHQLLLSFSIVRWHPHVKKCFHWAWTITISLRVVRCFGHILYVGYILRHTSFHQVCGCFKNLNGCHRKLMCLYADPWSIVFHVSTLFYTGAVLTMSYVYCASSYETLTRMRVLSMAYRV